MVRLTIDEFNEATCYLYFSTGDRATKKFWVTNMVENGVKPSVAGKVWAIALQSGRVKQGIVHDVTDTFLPANVTGIVRNVLLSLIPDGGLTHSLTQAIYQVTGLNPSSVQIVLNVLEVENFLEQRRAVNPWQYIPRKWGR